MNWLGKKLKEYLSDDLEWLFQTNDFSNQFFLGV
jgi:hypothetical protein